MNHITNIERLMKFCSKLHEIIGYPYYFNWSSETNHYDNTPDGEVKDINYVIFRVGKYTKEIKMPLGYETDRKLPVEKQTLFGPATLALNFLGLNVLTREKGLEIKSFEDVEKNKETIKKCIDEYIDENKIRIIKQ